MQRLNARPLKRFVQVRIPVIPKLHNVQESLKYRLILIVSTRCAQGHERLTVCQYDAWGQRVARARSRPQLRGACGIEPELLTSHTHSDTCIAKNDGAANPATTRSAVEDVACAIDNCDMRRVLDRASNRFRVGRRLA